MAHINARWRHIWLLRSLFVLEFLLLTTLLGLTGYNNPDTFTTKLRADGALNNFNSSPTLSTAPTPYVWSTALTRYNLTLSVASFLLLVASIALHILGIYVPAAAAAHRCALLAAWCVSVRAQAGADNADPRRPSPAPWFLRVRCGRAYYSANRAYCHIAKATFGVSVVLLACYVALLGLAVASVLVGRGPPGVRKEVLEEEGEGEGAGASLELRG